MVPWDVLTNTLAESCRLHLATSGENPQSPGPETERFARTFFGGIFSLVNVFGSIQGSPALAEVCKGARCAVRLPGVWSMVSAAFGSSLTVNFVPQFKSAVRLPLAASDAAQDEVFRVPIQMKSKERLLTTVEVLAGSATGPEVMLAGMRSLRAIHPVRTNQQFTAEILASGVVVPAPSTAR
jgi:hypothetical protein